MKNQNQQLLLYQNNNWLSSFFREKLEQKKYKSIEDFMVLKKVELCFLASKHKPKPVYEISEIAKEFNIKILFLPVGHPELNPIEMVWSQSKGYIKKKCKVQTV